MRFGYVALLSLLLCGCGVQIPADPYGTLDRVENGVVRVGATANSPWVHISETSDPAGTESELMVKFAEQLGSEVEWTQGSEAELMSALDRGELDAVVGGFLDDTPWAETGAITRPYREIETADGVEKHVMVVRMGENGFLVALEAFLLAEEGA